MMSIKCKFVAYVALFALLLLSVARGRILRTEEFEEPRPQARALFATEHSSTDEFVCANCEPPRGCYGVVNWCPPIGEDSGPSPSATPSPSNSLNSTSSPSPSPTSTSSPNPNPTSTPSPNPSPSPTPSPRAPLPNLDKPTRTNNVNRNSDEG